MTDTRRAFDEAAADFDRLAPHLWTPLAERMLAHARPAPGEHVLDACCGTGASALPTAELVGPDGLVDAVDISAPMIDRLTAEAAALPQLRPWTGDVTAWTGQAYDLVQSAMGIFFLPSMADSTARLAAACRPGGRVCFAIWQRGAMVDAGRRLTTAKAEVTGQQAGERPPHPIDDIDDADRYADWLRARGLTEVSVAVEPLTVPMTGDVPWLVVIGSGLRGMLTDLDQPAQVAVRDRYQALMIEQGPAALDATSLVGIAVWPGPPS